MVCFGASYQFRWIDDSHWSNIVRELILMVTIAYTANTMHDNHNERTSRELDFASGHDLLQQRGFNQVLSAFFRWIQRETMQDNCIIRQDVPWYTTNPNYSPTRIQHNRLSIIDIISFPFIDAWACIVRESSFDRKQISRTLWTTVAVEYR